MLRDIFGCDNREGISEQRLGMVPNILQCTRQQPPQRIYLAQDVKVWLLRNPSLDQNSLSQMIIFFFFKGQDRPASISFHFILSYILPLKHPLVSCQGFYNSFLSFPNPNPIILLLWSLPFQLHSYGQHSALAWDSPIFFPLLSLSSIFPHSIPYYTSLQINFSHIQF